MSYAKSWCFTINNYDEDNLILLRKTGDSPGVRYLVFQQEEGKEGTRHVQGYISLEKRQRLKQLKKLVGDRAHFEVAKGTAEQNRSYCSKRETAKAGTFEEFGEIPVTGKRNDLTEFIEYVKAGNYDYKELIESHPQICAKYPRFVKDVVRFNKPVQGVEDHSLREWQQHLRMVLAEEPSDRDVIFVVDEVGNQGKTWFAKWYCSDESNSAQYMNPGKNADMAYDLDENVRVLFINVTRQKTDTLQYSFIESVKDGMVSSPKYESYLKKLGKVHVVVMMNEQPDMKAMSKDRYNIINLY